MKRLVCLIAAAVSLMTAVLALDGDGALPIDLTGLDAYVREGFDPAWVQSVPDDYDAEWKKVSGKRGDRSLRIMDLGFSAVPKWRPFFRPDRDYQFTILFPFRLKGSDLRNGALGVLLAQIGQNWEVFVNGKLVRSELYLDRSGNITKSREMRNQVVELPGRDLIAGENVLGIRIIGDPTMDRTGLFMKSSYIVDRLASLNDSVVSTLDYMLLAIYFFFGLYHLALFARRRKEAFNLWFGAGTTLLSLHYFLRSNLAYRFFQDSATVKHFELFALIMTVACLTVFFDLIARGSVSFFTKVYFGISVLFAALVMPLEREFLPLWQYTLPVVLPYVLVYDLAIPFIAKIREAAADGGNSGGYPLLAARCLATTVPGNLIIGLTILLVTVLLDVKQMVAGNPVSYSKYGFFILMAGIVLVLANRFLEVHTAMELLNVTLEEKVEDRTVKLRAANEELGAAMSEMEAMNDSLVKTNRELEDAQTIMTRDMKMAVQVQSAFFPRSAPDDGAWDIDFVFQPLHGVSGDMYDFYADGRGLIGAGIFDVSGHGISSGLLTMLARSVIHRIFMGMENEKLGKVVSEINRSLVGEIGLLDNYITGIIMRFSGNIVEHVNAGHPDLIMKRAATGRARPVKPKDREIKGQFLGVEGMQSGYSVIGVPVEPGDLLFLHTDCMNESAGDDGEPFGQERIMEALENAPPDASASEIMAAVMYSFRSFVGDAPVKDDLTAMLLKRR